MRSRVWKWCRGIRQCAELRKLYLFGSIAANEADSGDELRFDDFDPRNVESRLRNFETEAILHAKTTS